MEIPFTADNYADIPLKTDKAAHIAANEAITELGIDNALCIGLVHGRVGTIQNPDLIAAYENLPIANDNPAQFSDLESLVLR